jgi:hypothetical protein
MPAIDFPNSPTVGQLFTVGDVTWEWTGSVWEGLGMAGDAGPTGASGEASFNSFLLMGA